MTYLGIKISGSSDFTKGTESSSIKAKNACSGCLKEKLSIEKLPLSIVNRLLKSFCSPICKHGSEIWGASLKDDFGHWKKHNTEN